MLNVKRLVLGHFETNCYIVSEDNHYLVFDPATSTQEIIAQLPEDAIVDAIVLTHGHYDHLGAVDELADNLQCPVYINEVEEELIRDPYKNCSRHLDIKVNAPVKYLKEGNNQVGHFNLTLYPTPGHTIGSSFIQYQNHLFTGDTLFYHDIGRTDLYSGSEEQMQESIRFIKTLNKDLVVHPGHGQSSTIGEEIKNNIYF